MNWLVLIVAGLFEVGWAVGLKYTEGFTRPWPTVGTVAAMVVSMALLGWAMRDLPVGTADSYATEQGGRLTVAAAAGVLAVGVLRRLFDRKRKDA